MECHTKVLILGAGMAGIAAARTMSKYGIHDYIILEAQDKLGGRICSIEGPDNITLELGAAWIHAANGTSVYDHAVHVGIKTEVTDYHENIIARDSQGRNVTADMQRSFGKLKHIYSLTDSLIERKKCFQTEMDLSQRALLTMSGWRPVSIADRAAEYVEFDFFYGDTPDTISTRFGDNKSELSELSEDYKVEDIRGYAHIISTMASESVSSHLKFNEHVKMIDYSCSKAVIVETSSGMKYTANYVIVTFSVGVLQKEQITFHPPMPSVIRERIHSIVLVNYKKIFMLFTCDSKMFLGDTGIVYYVCDRRGFYTVWEISYTPSNYTLLCTTLVGAHAEHADRLSEDDLKEEAMGVLRNMYGKDIPNPKWFKCTKWKENPYFCGAYSLMPVGFGRKDLEVIKCGLDNKVYFAGEAYSEEHYGEVEGAYETGEQAALKIINQVQNNFECKNQCKLF